jgi:hypothetical protein
MKINSVPSEYVLQDVNYVAASGRSLPAILLYTADDLGYCQFATEVWDHYDGFGNYCTCAIHIEHLVPRDGKPLGTRDETRKVREMGSEVQPTGKPKKPQAPRSLAKLEVSRTKADKNFPDPFRKVSTEHQGLNGKKAALRKPSTSEPLTRYNRPVRTLGGLSLADYLGRR